MKAINKRLVEQLPENLEKIKKDKREAEKMVLKEKQKVYTEVLK